MTIAHRISRLLVATLGLTAALAGCDSAGTSGGRAVSRQWLDEIGRTQREELLRPVTPTDWPAETLPSESPLAVTIGTQAPGSMHLAGEESPDLPAALVIEMSDWSRDADTLAQLSYQVLDFYGRRLVEQEVGEVVIPKGGKTSRRSTLDSLRYPGYYEVVVTLTWDGGSMVRRAGLAIVRPPEAGTVPFSRFACTQQGSEVPVAVRAGCKVCYVRNLIAGGIGVANWHERSPERPWHPQVDASPLEARLRPLEEAGLTCVGHIGFSREQAATGAMRTAPPQPAEAFACCTAPLVAELPTVRRWDIAPQLLSDYAGDAPVADFLAIQAGAVREARRGLDISVSGSAVALNDWLTAPRTRDLVDDLRFTSFSDEPSFAADVARRAGARTWTAVLPEVLADDSPQRRAWHCVKTAAGILAAGGAVELPRFVRLMTLDRTWESASRGGGNAFAMRFVNMADTAPMAAMAVMIERLEHTGFHGEVWPELPLVRSPVFDGRKHCVAVLWSDVTEDGTAAGTPSRGLLVVPDARYVKTEDCMGQAVGIWRERSLIVPLGEAPIYVSSERLGAADLVRRLRQSQMVGLAPVAVRAGCITTAIGPRATAVVHLAGMTLQQVEATVSVEGPRGWTPADKARKVTVEPGEEIRLEFDFKDAARNVDNAYPLTIRATVGTWQVERTLVAQQVAAPQLGAAVDGRLSEWSGVPSVTVVMPRPAAGDSAAAVQPNAPAGLPVASVRVAHDADFFYIAAEMPLGAPLKRERTLEPTGTWAGNPWGRGSIQLAFGPADESEPSHVLALVPTAVEPAVVRLHGPGMELRNPLPGLPVEGWGKVAGAEAAIVDAGDRVVYEAAIPRSALAALPWSRGSRWHFALLVGEGQAEWAAAAGVFDWQTSRRAFFPLGAARRAVRTELGLVDSAGETR